MTTLPKKTLLLPALLAVLACGGEDGADAALDAGTAADPAAGSADDTSVATATQAGTSATRSATFSGPAINGVVPQGEAKVSVYAPGTLQVRLRNVNLPDGTVLTVTLAGYPVGTIRISARQGSASLPTSFQVGINTVLAIRLGASTLMWTTWH